jgi:hypothetical protein
LIRYRPGQKFLDPVHRMVGNALQHMAQVSRGARATSPNFTSSSLSILLSF